MRRSIHVISFSLLLALGGCGDNGGTDDARSGDGAAEDAGPGTAQSWTFSAEDVGDVSPAILLRAESIEQGLATLSLVGRGIDKLQGLAFRLTFDPQAITVVTSKPGSIWPADNIVHRFKSRAEGELWAGIAHKGPRSLAATTDEVLAEVTLELGGIDPQEISFRPRHNLVLDPEGRAVTVQWLGGTFNPLTE